jgi:hypothetical protein
MNSLLIILIILLLIYTLLTITLLVMVYAVANVVGEYFAKLNKPAIVNEDIKVEVKPPKRPKMVFQDDNASLNY